MAVFIGERGKSGPDRKSEVTGTIFFAQADIKPGLQSGKPIDIIPRLGDKNVQTVTVLFQKGIAGQTRDTVLIKTGYPNPANPQEVSVRDEATFSGEEIDGIRFISTSLISSGDQMENRQTTTELWYENIV